MFKKIFFLTCIYALFIFAGCQYFTLQSYKEWNDKNSSSLPLEVNNLNIVEGYLQIYLSWIDPSDNDFSHVKIIVENEGVYIGEYDVLKGKLFKTFIGLKAGSNYNFRVITIDKNGKKSAGVYKEGVVRNFSNGLAYYTATLSNPIIASGMESTSGTALQGRTVILSSYWLGKYEVTYAQWYEVYTWAIINGYSFANYGTEGSASSAAASSIAPTSRKNEPVTFVNWRDCMVWCNALSEKESLTPCYTYSGSVIRDSRDANATACDNAVLTLTNNGYRLPTEAEWEYAASGGSLTHGYTYSGSNNLSDVAWYDSNSGGSTHNVGTKASNELGMYDMSGNVYEWMTDGRGTITTGITETNPISPMLSPTDPYRSTRGGGYNNTSSTALISSRNSNSLAGEEPGIGFRIARTK
jgi:formylglycine-generating enzyme